MPASLTMAKVRKMRPFCQQDTDLKHVHLNLFFFPLMVGHLKNKDKERKVPSSIPGIKKKQE